MIENQAGPADGRTRKITYSIGTLVTDYAQYEAMRASFEVQGFKAEDCEFLYIDNTRLNQMDGYAGLNQLLNRACGQYVVLCHQDVRMISDGRAKLDAELDSLEQLDPSWALVGNAGGVSPGRLALRVTDPHGADTYVGPLPARVTSLDENFIVVKQAARLGFSSNLRGFHFYGADICLAADILGYSAYVIDFHLQHLSPGTKSADFFAAQSAFQSKWSHALRSRWVQTTCALVPLSGNHFGRVIGTVAARPFGKVRRWLRTRAAATQSSDRRAPNTTGHQ